MGFLRTTLCGPSPKILIKRVCFTRELSLACTFPSTKGSPGSLFNSICLIPPLRIWKSSERPWYLSTQGRSFWAIDDLSPLHQWDQLADKESYLFEPRNVYRSNTGKRQAQFHVFMADEPDSQVVYSLEVFNAGNQLVRKWSTQPDQDSEELKLTLKKGMNLIPWDLRYPGPQMVEGFAAMVMQAGKERGPMAVPGFFDVVFSDWRQ